MSDVEPILAQWDKKLKIKDFSYFSEKNAKKLLKEKRYFK